MNRRSFLRSILAAGVAPWVMSNGVAGGVLMPVRKIVAPVESALLIYSGTPEYGGTLLAKIGIDSSWLSKLTASGSGDVIATGVATYARLSDDGGKVLAQISIGGPCSDADMRLSTDHLTTGQILLVNMMLKGIGQ